MKVTSTKKPIDLIRSTGLSYEGGQAVLVNQDEVRAILALKLAAYGIEVPDNDDNNSNSGSINRQTSSLLSLSKDIFRVYHEQTRLLENHLCPIDERIQNFLNDVFQDLDPMDNVQLPSTTLNLDRYGLARELSFPENATEYHNSEIDSYRLLKNSVLHNPMNDKRTTEGVFHIADYGLPVPADKIAVPLVTYARLLRMAFQPPSEINVIPYTSRWPSKRTPESLISLQLRPLVAPEVPGVMFEKRSEVRFFVPGGCVSNLDFVESIFGNGGDPYLPENDAGLDTYHWTGTTGCVILAPHLRACANKKAVGLPHVSVATELQKKHGMCYTNDDELYHNGKPFKITLRDNRGIMVTILADNYFGYCKKEVKAQIGLSANIFGLSEEEHAGGALAFKTNEIGEKFNANPRYMQILVPSQAVKNTYQFADALQLLGETVTINDELSYATDKKYPTIHVLPEDMNISLLTQTATYTHYKTGKEVTIRVLPYHTYMHPSGYKVYVDRHPTAPKWRLVGTLAEPAFCHKPSTVSGGGKSEISKSLNDAVIHGPIFIGDYEKEMSIVQSIIERDYSNAILPQYKATNSDSSRPILSPSRTLGSVIKLLTPDDIYTPEHNEFVMNIPNQLRAIIFTIKDAYKEETNTNFQKDWKKLFTVDMSNGVPGHELKYNNRQLVGSYLRVGFLDGQWRNYKLRQDFIAADKVQMEDDITASIVVPREQIYGLPIEYSKYPSLKISQNCEWRLFQRPDDAIHPGYDQQTEHDMAGPGMFISNFEPLSRDDMKQLSEQIYCYDLFTEEMQQHISDCAHGTVHDPIKTTKQYNICSAKPRMVDGAPTKNPRYLQVRPDVERPRDRYVAEMGARLYRRLHIKEPCIFPVAGVLSGRRNNTPDELNGNKILPLCVYNPIHYQELPELFMDYICCVTGKSPSTTGAGSEGALSKGPFNAIGATADLNNMLVSMLLCGYGGYSSAAGYIGPKYRMDHDVSLLIPELWCRMTTEERDPNYLIQNGYLEPVQDFEYKGRTIPGSRLGYRITKHFVHHFFCRIFDNPSGVFTDDMLQPEIQDMDVYVAGIENICQAMKQSALNYFNDGIINDACPPLRAILHVMAYGHYNGKSIQDPIIRSMFTREYLINSEWYKQRLYNKQQHDIHLWDKNVQYLYAFIQRPGYTDEADRLKVREQLHYARQELQYVISKKYYNQLIGTLGKDNLNKGYKLVAKDSDHGITTDIEPIVM